MAVKLTVDPLSRVLTVAIGSGHLRAACVVAALALGAFANSLGNGFVFDDEGLIVQNPDIRRVADLPLLFQTPYWTDPWQDRLYRPLVMVTYGLNYAIGGLNPFGYHLVNVLLHGATSALVYLLVWILFRARLLAWLSAALFALHPIHTEAVANIAGRAELLAAAFVFLAWLLYLHRDSVARVPRPPSTSPSPPEGEKGWDEGESAAHRHPRTRACLLAGSVASFALALLSKEHAVILLGLLVLSDLLRHIQDTGGLAGAGRVLIASMRRTYAVYLIVTAAYLLVRFRVLGTIMGIASHWTNNPLVAVEWPTRMLTAVAVFGRYCRLLLVPARLSADYSYAEIPLSHSPFEAAVLLPGAGLLCALALAGAVWRRQPVYAFGLLLGFIAFVPVANLFFPIGTIMAERLLYLPSLGFCLVLAAGIVELSPRLSRRAFGSAALLAACGALLLAYAGRCIVRNRDWHSTLTLWSATVRTSPRSVKAHYNLGEVLLSRDDLEGSERQMRIALQIYPESHMAHNALGAALMRQGRATEALAAFGAALRIWPEFAPAHLNLGRLYERQGLHSPALDEYRLAAAHAPRFPSLELHLALASAFFSQGDLAEAERWLKRVVQTRPDSAEAHFDLGTVYRKHGRLAEAVSAFREALRLKPGYAKAHYALGIVLQQQGRLQEARRSFEEADLLMRRASPGERR